MAAVSAVGELAALLQHFVTQPDTSGGQFGISASKASPIHPSSSPLLPSSPLLTRGASDFVFRQSSFSSPFASTPAGAATSSFSSPGLERSVSGLNASFMSPNTAQSVQQETLFLEWFQHRVTAPDEEPPSRASSPPSLLELPYSLSRSDGSDSVAKALMFGDAGDAPSSHGNPSVDLAQSMASSSFSIASIDTGAGADAFSDGVARYVASVRAAEAAANSPDGDISMTPLFDAFIDLVKIVAYAPVASASAMEDCGDEAGRVFDSAQFQNPAKATKFAVEALQQLWSDVQSYVPTTLLGALLKIPAIKLCTELSKQLLATAEARRSSNATDSDFHESKDLQTIAASQRGMLGVHKADGSAVVMHGGLTGGPSDLSMPFEMESESKIFLKHKHDALAFAEREKCRDIFISILREFRDIGTSFTGTSWEEFVRSLGDRLASLRSHLHPSNVTWFAKLFLHELRLFTMHDCVSAGHGDQRLWGPAHNHNTGRLELLSARLADRTAHFDTIAPVRPEKPVETAPAVPINVKGAWKKPLQNPAAAPAPAAAPPPAIPEKISAPKMEALSRRFTEKPGEPQLASRPNTSTTAKRAVILPASTAMSSSSIPEASDRRQPDSSRVRNQGGVRSVSHAPHINAATLSVPACFTGTDRLFVIMLIGIDSYQFTSAVSTEMTRELASSCNVSHVQERLGELQHKTVLIYARQCSIIAKFLTFLQLDALQRGVRSSYPSEAHAAARSLTSFRFSVDMRECISTAACNGTLPVVLAWVSAVFDTFGMLVGGEALSRWTDACAACMAMPRAIRTYTAMHPADASVLVLRLWMKDHMLKFWPESDFSLSETFPSPSIASSSLDGMQTIQLLVGHRLSFRMSSHLKQLYEAVTKAPSLLRSVFMQRIQKAASKEPAFGIPRSNSASFRKICPVLISQPSFPSKPVVVPAGGSGLLSTAFQTSLVAAWFRQQPEIRGIADAIVQLLSHNPLSAAADREACVRQSLSCLLQSKTGRGAANQGTTVDLLTKYILGQLATVTVAPRGE